MIDRQSATGLDDSVRFSLVIPAHNEEARLESTLRNYGDALEKAFGRGAEIIVVANGCADRTIDIARALSAELPSIRAVDVEAPIGKGGAILVGFLAARGDAVAFADADGATAIASILGLLEDLATHQVVIGSRRLPGSRITRQQSLRRRFLGRVFNAAARLTLGIPFSDTQCGAKAFRRDASRHLAGLVVEKRWMFDLDLLLCARSSGLSIIERPVEWADVPGSRLGVVRTLAEVAPAFWRLHVRHCRRSSLKPEPEPAEFLRLDSAVHGRDRAIPAPDSPAGAL